MTAIAVALDEPTSIELWIPYPPSANHIWRTGGKRVYRSPKYMKWREDAAVETLRPGNQFKRKHKIIGPYKLTVTAARPDKRKRDLDNILKPISDFLMFIGAIESDHLCDMICARWSTEGEGVYVRVERAGVL